MNPTGDFAMPFLYESTRFKVVDHGDKGVEVLFAYASADGPSPASKWFMDGASAQMRADAEKSLIDRGYLFRRCLLDPEETLTFDALDAAPAPKP